VLTYVPRWNARSPETTVSTGDHDSSNSNCSNAPVHRVVRGLADDRRRFGAIITGVGRERRERLDVLSLIAPR
jgi:hypothetical protein